MGKKRLYCIVLALNKYLKSCGCCHIATYEREIDNWKIESAICKDTYAIQLSSQMKEYIVLRLWLKIQRHTNQTQDCPGFSLSVRASDYTYFFKTSSLCSVIFIHKNNIGRDLVCSNNILVMEVRRMPCSIWFFKKDFA